MAPKWLCFPLKTIQGGWDSGPEPSRGHGALLLLLLPLWQILSLLPVGQMCSVQKLHGAGILWQVKLLFDGMPDGLGVLFPKGWVPPRPAVLASQPCQEGLSSWRAGGFAH